MEYPDDPAGSAAVLTLVRLRASELRVGDLYLTGSAPAIRRRITARLATVAPVDGVLAAAVELGCADGTTPVLLADQWVRAERDLRPLASVTGPRRRDFAAAHAEGLHADAPREFCPDCEAVTAAIPVHGRHDRGVARH